MVGIKGRCKRNGPGYAASFFISLLVRDRTFLMVIVRWGHPGKREPRRGLGPLILAVG